LADDNLKLLDIYSLKDKCFNELSGGQRQRVLLARSLCSTSKILILDEPSNNLDYNSKKNLYKILQYLNEEKTMTIIMVTHDLDHNNLIGNKILSLQKGNYFYGNTNDFVKKVHHE
ncbi:ATP-binding cassette domain-containing protein, partial [bacterium]|nr:ATP-binding cassette domain-containing protein [bacterium]